MKDFLEVLRIYPTSFNFVQVFYDYSGNEELEYLIQSN